MTTTEQRDFNSYTCTVCGQETGSMGHGAEPCPGPAKKVKVRATDFEKMELMLKKSWQDYVVEDSQMTEGGKCIVVYNEDDAVQIEFYFDRHGTIEHLTSFAMDEEDMGVEFDVATTPEEATHGS
jgi:hypothetical protein